MFKELRKTTISKSLGIYQRLSVINKLPFFILFATGLLSNSPTIAQLPVFDKSTLTRHEITQDGGIISFRYNKVLSGSNTTVSSSPGAAGGTSFDYDHSASYDIFWEILKYDSLGREQWRTDMEEQYKNSKYVLSKDGNCAFEIAEIVTYPLLGKPISELQVRRLDMNGYFSIPISVYPEENRWKEVLDFSTGSNINFFIQPENSPKIKEICDPIKTLWVRIDENLNITTDTIFFPTFNSKKIDNITFTFIGSREADAQFIVNYTNKDIAKGNEVQTELITLSSNGNVDRKNLTNVIPVSSFAQELSYQNFWSYQFFMGDASAFRMEPKTNSIFFMYFGEDKKSIAMGKISMDGKLLWEKNYPIEKMLSKKSVVFYSQFALYDDQYISLNLFDGYYKYGKMMILEQGDGLMVATEEYPAKRKLDVVNRIDILTKVLGESGAYNYYTKAVNGELLEEPNLPTIKTFSVNGSPFTLTETEEPKESSESKEKEVSIFYYNINKGTEYLGLIRNGKKEFKTFPIN